MTVVGQAGTLAEARGLLHGVDIAVIDLALPDGNGMELLKELHAASPQSQALEAGAACVLQTSVGIGDIIGAIRGLHAGRGRLA